MSCSASLPYQNHDRWLDTPVLMPIAILKKIFCDSNEGRQRHKKMKNLVVKLKITYLT